MSPATSCKVLEVVRLYLYAAVSTASGLFIGGVRDWRAIGLAALSAILAPVTQVLNPKDSAIGFGSKKR